MKIDTFYYEGGNSSIKAASCNFHLVKVLELCIVQTVINFDNPVHDGQITGLKGLVSGRKIVAV